MSQQSTVADTRIDVARLAGRGTIYITAAKVWFMLTGAGIHFIVARLLTLEEFGIYTLVVQTVSIVNAVIITGTYQTVSRYVSQEPERAGAVKSKALRLQALVGGGIAAGFILLAPVTAWVLNDAGLVDYLRLAGLITLAYAFYAVYTGYFNGQRRFLTQAALDAGYSTIKLCFIVGLVWLGLGVAGGIGGFALAAGTILLISVIVAGRPLRKGFVRASDLLNFQFYLLGFTLLLNFLQRIDTVLIKMLSASDPAAASMNVGYWMAAMGLANLTYQIVISVTFVVFPLVSRSEFEQDVESIRTYISTTLRYSLIVMVLVATLFSANAAEALSVVYRPEFQASQQPLAIIAYGMVFFGLLFIVTTIITASGRPGLSMSIGGLALSATIILNALLIPRYGLIGAAVATTASMFIGAAAGGGYLLMRFGALVPPLSALRICGAAALVYVASLALTPSSRMLIIGQFLVLGVLYLAALIVTRELGARDLAALHRVLGLRQSAG